MRLDAIGWIAMVLVIIGALNWGFIGIFNIDIIGLFFGKMSLLNRFIDILIALAAVWLIYAATKERKKKKG